MTTNETRKVCLEVALNGPWSRKQQPGIPLTTSEIVAEGIACARLGAAVIHLHVYDPDTGKQWENFDAYRSVIEAIREHEDVIVYPTLPLAGSPDTPDSMGPEKRFQVVEQLAKAGLLEWAVIDPGSATFASYDDISSDQTGFLYANTETEVRHGLALAQEYGFHPSYAIYEPGFARLGAALAVRYPMLPKPVYRFMFSDGFAFGYPPRAYALDSYVQLLQELDSEAPWMIAGLQVDILPLIGNAVSLAGHVRVGLEDAPFGSNWSNMQWTEAALQQITSSGANVMTVNEVRSSIFQPGTRTV